MAPIEDALQPHHRWEISDCLVATGCEDLEDNVAVMALEASSANYTTLITVVDLVANSSHECPVRSLDKTDSDRCPENKIHPFGQSLMLLSLGVFLGLGAIGVCATYSDKCGRFLFWTVLLTFWAADCSVGLFSGMYAQINFPTGLPLVMSLVLNVVFFDVPMFALKLVANYQPCFPDGVFNLLYIVLVTSFGSLCSISAIGWAYSPATIIVVGHHPLLLGLKTFLLQFPKKIAMNYIKNYIKKRMGFQIEKHRFFTELSWFFNHIAEPLPRAIVRVAEYEQLLDIEQPDVDPPEPIISPERPKRCSSMPRRLCSSFCLLLLVLVVLLFCCVLFRAPTCSQQLGQVDGCETFHATVRDFKRSHPDFEHPALMNKWTATKGLVQKKLGEDRKPVFRGGPTLSTQQHFHEWYNNVPGVNVPVPIKLDMTRTTSGSLVMDSSNFFPIDGKGFKDEIYGHNYWFTMEMHHTFVYKGGERFTFHGDDDIWVFINGLLVLDLGGAHTPLEETINLDNLGLAPGQHASFDVFYAERHTSQSNLRIETTLELEQQNHCVIDIKIEILHFEQQLICFAKRPWWMVWGLRHHKILDNDASALRKYLVGWL
jgi:fibro-slime domain-containing protein